jgi:adenylate cyclase
MIVYRILTEEKEKKAIQGMFSNYVSKRVVEELLKHPEKLVLGGEDKQITVLFSDIRGFTTLSEKLTPQELVAHLNEYLSAMTDLIFKYEGTLDKYVGDEIMAFWNAPVEQENHAELACRTALEMMEVLKQLNEQWPEEKKLNIGIGLNTGVMTVGNMGSKSRMDYTLMGDSVNLGARLEGTNKIYGTNIIISEFTYEQVKDRFVCRELDNIRVKGKQKPVKIFQVMDYLGEPIPAV